jgi:hypothetical protein
MSLDPISAVSNLISTGLDKFFPDRMSEDDKEKLKFQMLAFSAEEARKAGSAFRDFVVQYEGAAKDYTNIPIIGPTVLLVRGLIRPAFTVLVGYLDWLYFSGVGWTDEQSSLLKAVNIVVLMFWFGERAIQNTGLVDLLLKRKP